MTETVRECIFDSSFTTTAMGKGTRLKVAIAKQIVEEKHNGTLTCTSAPGRDNEFAIELPLIDSLNCTAIASQ